MPSKILSREKTVLRSLPPLSANLRDRCKRELQALRCHIRAALILQKPATALEHRILGRKELNSTAVSMAYTLTVLGISTLEPTARRDFFEQSCRMGAHMSEE